MLSKQKLVLVGGGGHCKVVVSILKKLDTFDIIGISDIKENIGKKTLGIKTLYTDDQLEQVYKNGIENALVTIGSIGDPSRRITLYEMLKDLGFNIPSIVSKDAIVDESVRIGKGTVILPGVIINPDTKIGENCIINTGAIIEHDCVIGDHVHIAPGVTLSGSVKVGDRSHLGTGASVIQGIQIENDVIVGAGGVVVKDIGESGTYFGVPVKINLKF